MLALSAGALCRAGRADGMRTEGRLTGRRSAGRGTGLGAAVFFFAAVLRPISLRLAGLRAFAGLWADLRPTGFLPLPEPDFLPLAMLASRLRSPGTFTQRTGNPPVFP